MNSAERLAAIARQDQAAFTALYRAMQPQLERYAAGLLAGDMAAAADAVDEAFLDIWKQAGAYTGDGSAEGWIRRIVRNKAVDWLRRQKEKSGLSEGEQAAYDQTADSADTPDVVAEKKSDGDELRAAMARLSVEHRETLWLCYFENKSVSDIAQMMSVPENTVKTRLFNARKQMKQLLSPADTHIEDRIDDR